MQTEALTAQYGKNRRVAELAVIGRLDSFALGCELLKDARINIEREVAFLTGLGREGDAFDRTLAPTRLSAAMCSCWY